MCEGYGWSGVNTPIRGVDCHQLNPTTPNQPPNHRQFKQLDEAIVAVIDYLGMQPCDGTAASVAGTKNATTHNLHLAGVSIGLSENFFLEGECVMDWTHI